MDHLIEKLARKLQLGGVTAPLELLTGGLSHTSWAVETKQGKFVFKRLNPTVMKRPEAPNNFRLSEALAQRLSNRLPAVTAIPFEGDVLIPFENDFYMLFPFVPGRVVKSDEITAKHCAEIGKILSAIHTTESTAAIAVNECPLYPWRSYPALAKHADALEYWNRQANQAMAQLQENLVTSHRDLDPKNVLWDGDELYMIDWEAAGLIHPALELWEACINWGSDSAGQICPDHVAALQSSYGERRHFADSDWRAASFAGYAGVLGWLHYNWLRISAEDIPLEERQLGKEQVEKTLHELAVYEQKCRQISALT